MTPNPYHIRNAIRDDHYFVGRARELTGLLALVYAPQPQSVAIIGDPHIGKSSLLQALHRRCRERDDTVVLYLDVSGMYSGDEVLAALIDGLSVDGDMPGGKVPSLQADLRRLINRHTKRSRVVLLLDEFEVLTEHASIPVTFLNFLRSLANEFPVALVLTATRRLKDTYRNEELAGSPFFNIFHELRLGSLTDAEAVQLIAVPSGGIGRSLHPHAAAITHYVGHWPFFVQIMCYSMLEAESETSIDSERWAIAKSRTLDSVLPHLEYLWQQLSDLERHALTEAAQGRRLADLSPAGLDALIARGFISHTDSGGVELAFELLHDFVSSLRETRQPSSHTSRKLSIFISYCHRDAEFVARWGVIDTLKDLESDGFDVFSDQQLATGDHWNDVLARKLEESRILVALVTQDYLRSRYCQEVELKAFWDERVRHGLVIFPIILGPCEWERHSWLRSTQFFPRTGTVMAHKPLKRRQLLIEVLSELRALGSRLSSERGTKRDP